MKVERHRFLGTACAIAVLVASASALAKDARAIHEKLLTLDTHLDTPSSFARQQWNIMDRHSVADNLTQVDYPRMKQGGLDGGFWAIFTGQGPRTEAGERAARDAALIRAMQIREMVAANPKNFSLALQASDAEKIAASHKRIVYLSIENGYPLGRDASMLDTFYKLGVRLFGPVHFRNNDLGDSATDPAGPEWHGLSPFGKQLVVEANRLGVVLDASHASDEVLEQMIALSKTPIMLSHSGCKAVFDHPRNIDDRLLKKLGTTGGVIQINSLSDYLISAKPNPEREKALGELTSRFGRTAEMAPEKLKAYAIEREQIMKRYPVTRATFEDFMRHLLHALKVAGVDHVGIGADWDGGGGVIGMEDVSALPKITERLLREGYTETDLQKIWSGNVLRVLRAAEAARQIR